MLESAARQADKRPVVEVIKHGCKQHPVHRDPAMFNASEVENGPASRKMTYKTQKWNVNSDRVILVANARVDWMAS